MQIFNSQSKQKELFSPIEEGKVSIYSCGSTVYDYPHLGHARNAVAFDLLHRVLLYLGYEVNFVKNYTDIDDKIIARASKEDKSIQDITTFYIQAEQEQMKSLAVLESSLTPKATEYIQSMIDFISQLLDKDLAYKLDDGIYFDTSKDDKYGSISGRLQSDGLNRVTHNANKRNVSDFVLWKFDENSSTSFEGALGSGRPGWHTECSCMISEIFKDNKEFFVDIHCGGSDLLFPHHENEATQVRTHHKQEIAKYWMHNGFVQVGNEKMSKSLGNSFCLKDTLQEHHPEVVRLYLLSTHYRANIDLSKQGLSDTKKVLDKLYRLAQKVIDAHPKEDTGKDTDEFSLVVDALKDDLNTSVALSHINTFVHASNEQLTMKAGQAKALKSIKQDIKSYLLKLNLILGVVGCDPFDYFRFGLNQEDIDRINTLIETRNSHRKSKNYQQADEIKNTLIEEGVSLMDTAQGTFWEKSSS